MNEIRLRLLCPAMGCVLMFKFPAAPTLPFLSNDSWCRHESARFADSELSSGLFESISGPGPRRMALKTRAGPHHGEHCHPQPEAGSECWPLGQLEVGKLELRGSDSAAGQIAAINIIFDFALHSLSTILLQTQSPEGRRRREPVVTLIGLRAATRRATVERFAHWHVTEVALVGPPGSARVTPCPGLSVIQVVVTAGRSDYGPELDLLQSRYWGPAGGRT